MAPEAVNWPVVFTMLFVIMCDALNQLVVFPFLPFMIRDQLELAPDDPKLGSLAGFAAAAYNAGQFLGAPLYGTAADRLGRKPVLLVCLMLSGLCILGFAMSSSYAISLGMRSAQGFFSGAVIVGKIVLFDVTTPATEAQVFGMIGLSFAFGYMLGPTIGGVLAQPSAQYPALFGGVALLEAHPYLLPCAATFAFSMVGLAGSLLLLPETHPRLGKGAAPSNARPLLGLDRRTPSRDSQVAGVAAELATCRPSVVLVDPLVGGDVGVRTSVNVVVAEVVSRISGGSSVSSGESCYRLSRISGGGGSSAGSGGSWWSLSGSGRSEREMPASVEGSVTPRMSAERGTEEGEAPTLLTTTFVRLQLSVMIFCATTAGRATVAPDARACSATFHTCAFRVCRYVETLPVWLATPVSGGGLGLSATSIGVLTAVGGFSLLLTSVSTGFLLGRFGGAYVLHLGYALNALNSAGPPLIALLLGWWAAAPPLLPVAILVVCCCMNMASKSFAFTAVTMLSKGCVPPAVQGLALGVNQSCSSTGLALGPLACGVAYSATVGLVGPQWGAAVFFLALTLVGLWANMLVVGINSNT